MYCTSGRSIRSSWGNAHVDEVHGKFGWVGLLLVISKPEGAAKYIVLVVCDTLCTYMYSFCCS
jgi:hypothetical protein